MTTSTWFACIAQALLSLLASAQQPASGPRAPTGLRCEARVDPRGIETRAPRFSWQVDDPRPAAVQSAWRVLVARSPGALREERGELWDSGVVRSAETAWIRYAGAPLPSDVLCHWSVQTFDADGRPSPWSAPASFSTGKLDERERGASWICDPTPVEPAVGARHGFHSRPSAKADDFHWVQLDLGDERIFEGFRLHPARPVAGEGSLFPLQFKIWVSADPAFTTGFQKTTDETFFDFPDPGVQAVEIDLRPVRYKLRYVRIGVSKSRPLPGGGFGFALAEFEVLEAGVAMSRGARASASDSIETGPWSVGQLTDGDLGSHGPIAPALPGPILRGEFTLEGPVARATLRASALGLYEVRINGAKVGDRALAPGWTDYKKRVEAQTYDVTALLGRENAIAALLGDGWYAGRLGLASQFPGAPPRAIYGRTPMFSAELEVELEGGTRRRFATDGSWRSTLAGPIRASDLLDGEQVDARAEIAGFDRPGFDATTWSPVEVVAGAAPTPSAERSEPIRVLAELPALSRRELRADAALYDFGRNLTGRCRVVLAGPPGTQVTLRHGEMLDERGLLYTANLRTAAQTDVVTLGAGELVFEPRFTLHGFRYLEISGITPPPAAGKVQALVIGSDLRPSASFECSDERLERLWANIARTAQGNLVGIPTDCPQRDERLGWLGDMQVFAPTAAFQLEAASFLDKWLDDVRDAVDDGGRMPDFAPHPYAGAGFRGAPGWADAGVLVPWTAWTFYGDRDGLERSFEAAAAWVEWVRKRNPELLWKRDRGNDYGDWLDASTLQIESFPPATSVDRELFASAFLARSSELVARMAAALSRDEGARREAGRAAEVRAAFRKAYVKEDARIEPESQGAYALALDFELFDPAERTRAAERLAGLIRASGMRLSGGIQTLHRALLALSQHGQHALALELVRASDPGSLLYPVEHGATTVWERRDGWIEGRGFQDPAMNSFSHVAFGAVGEWLMREIGGLEPDPEHPGWRRFGIHLREQPGLEHARAEYRSPAGAISSSWRKTAAGIAIELLIPANTSAVVTLPAARPEDVESGGRRWQESPGVRFVSAEKGECRFEAGAGHHVLSCRVAR